MRQESKDFAKTEEDVLSYVMLPQVAKTFLEGREAVKSRPLEEEDKVRTLIVEDLTNGNF